MRQKSRLTNDDAGDNERLHPLCGRPIDVATYDHRLWLFVHVGPVTALKCRTGKRRIYSD